MAEKQSNGSAACLTAMYAADELSGLGPRGFHWNIITLNTETQGGLYLLGAQCSWSPHRPDPTCVSSGGFLIFDLITKLIGV